MGTAGASDFLENGVFEKSVFENSFSKVFEPIENPDEDNKVDSLFFDEPWTLFERPLKIQGLKTSPTWTSSLADSDDEIAAPKSRRSEPSEPRWLFNEDLDLRIVSLRSPNLPRLGRRTSPRKSSRQLRSAKTQSSRQLSSRNPSSADLNWLGV